MYIMSVPSSPVSPDPAVALTSPVTATAGDTRTLQCNASANPQAEFLWSHDTAGELTGQGEDGNLEVTFDNLCEAGTYTCTPHNDHGDGDGATISVTLTGLRIFLFILHITILCDNSET